jgi:hypothetical protein
LVRAQSRDKSGDLDWVAGLLAAPPVHATVGRGSLSPTTARETFGVLPTAARPRVLVPLATKRAAAAPFRGASHAREPQVRLGRVLLRIGMRAGIAQHLFRDRLSISLAGEDETSDLLGELSLTDHLRDVFGRRDIAVAVHVGRARPNWKPLVQVLSLDGNVLGYVKVGWNPLTRALVENEARVLADLELRAASCVTFEVPRILHNGKWRELEILALSPLHGRLMRPTRSSVAPVAAAMNEVARLSAGYETQLARSGYWQAMRGRITAAASDDGIAHLADLVEERHVDDVLSFGSWHGDWTPWNMAWRGTTLAVWDWERSDDAVPVGLDAAHFDFQVALRAARHRSANALHATLAGDTPLLSSLALPRDRERLLLALHLLEMSVRREEGRRAGITAPDSTYLPALAALLERH